MVGVGAVVASCVDTCVGGCAHQIALALTMQQGSRRALVRMQPCIGAADSLPRKKIAIFFFATSVPITGLLHLRTVPLPCRNRERGASACDADGVHKNGATPALTSTLQFSCQVRSVHKQASTSTALYDATCCTVQYGSAMLMLRHHRFTRGRESFLPAGTGAWVAFGDLFRIR